MRPPLAANRGVYAATVTLRLRPERSPARARQHRGRIGIIHWGSRNHSSRVRIVTAELISGLIFAIEVASARRALRWSGCLTCASHDSRTLADAELRSRGYHSLQITNRVAVLTGLLLCCFCCRDFRPPWQDWAPRAFTTRCLSEILGPGFERCRSVITPWPYKAHRRESQPFPVSNHSSDFPDSTLILNRISAPISTFPCSIAER
jgi:hypothetical protein